MNKPIISYGEFRSRKSKYQINDGNIYKPFGSLNDLGAIKELDKLAHDIQNIGNKKSVGAKIPLNGNQALSINDIQQHEHQQHINFETAHKQAKNNKPIHTNMTQRPKINNNYKDTKQTINLAKYIDVDTFYTLNSQRIAIDDNQCKTKKNLYKKNQILDHGAYLKNLQDMEKKLDILNAIKSNKSIKIVEQTKIIQNNKHRPITHLASKKKTQINNNYQKVSQALMFKLQKIQIQMKKHVLKSEKVQEIEYLVNKLEELVIE